MDSDLLRTFLAVQRTRHFAQAAEQLYLTPSAVSFRIRQLETELGVSLFHRRRSNIQLTAAGERLVAHAEALLAGWQQAKAAVGGLATSHLRLNLATPPFWPELLPGGGSTLLALAGEHSLTLDWQSLPPSPLKAFREGRADLLIAADVEDEEGLVAVELTRLDWHWYGQRADLPPLYVVGSAAAWLPAAVEAYCWRGLSVASALALVANGAARALLPAPLVTAAVATLQLPQLASEVQPWRALWRQEHEQDALLARIAKCLAPISS